MSLKFWDNPLVVTAFRVKDRRRGFKSTVAIYLLVFTVIGGVIQYYSNYLGPKPWPQIYYLVLMGLQFVISGLVAVSETSASMKSEVSNRTLDFQRIATLSPRQILLGKLLGEPVLAYMLAIATIPLAVFCWIAGGVLFPVLVVMYLNLATNTLMIGSAGLQCRIDSPTGKSDLGFGAFLGVGLGFLTPIAGFVAVATNDPWKGLPLFGVSVPYLLLTPVLQLLAAYLSFRIMERQLINPLNPHLSKKLAYGTLIFIDLLTAAQVYEPGQGIQSLAVKGGIFLLVHLLACLFLILSVTPTRDCLLSWVWRFRGRVPRWRDWWLGDRSENFLVLQTFCAIGLGMCIGFVILPAVANDGWEALEPSLWNLLLAGVTALVLTLALGSFHQCCVLIGGRQANALMIGLLIMGCGLPPMLGQLKDLQWLTPLSPATHFVAWMGGPAAAYNCLSMLGLYALLLLLSRYLIDKRLSSLARVVDKKLRWMGVRPPQEMTEAAEEFVRVEKA